MAADLLPVGTRIRTKIDCLDDNDGVERRAPAGTEGEITAVFPKQEHCYSVTFSTGVWNFFSTAELAQDLEVLP